MEGDRNYQRCLQRQSGIHGSRPQDAGTSGNSRRVKLVLYHLLFPLHSTYSAFNVFRYITFRAALAALMALLISFLLGPYIIRSLAAAQMSQPIREDGPASHTAKAGTPTMGGTLI